MSTAPLVHLDTHVVAWLYAGELNRIPGGVQTTLEESTLEISPIVALELQYLFEIKRVRHDADTVLTDLTDRIGLRGSKLAFSSVVEFARKQRWTRDPFDRIIVGHAAFAGVPLLTKDKAIRKHYSLATWA